MDENKKINREDLPAAEDEGKPEAPDWLFENIAEASKLARRVYLIYISFLLYSAVTAVGITDRQLLLNENVTLPILKTTMPLTGFYVLAPLVCLFLYLYFQLYVHRIDGMVDQLEADYSSLPYRRLYPWMINIAADPEPGMMGLLQRFVVDITGWALLLGVLYLVLFSSQRGQNMAVFICVALTLLGTLIVFAILHSPKRRRISAEKQNTRRFRFWRRSRFLYAVVSVALVTLVMLFSDIMVLFRKESLLFGPFRARYDFSFQSLSSQPALETELIYWLYLRQARLKAARLLHTNLRRTDLSDARLTGAEGDSANFTGCNFFRARLDEGTFRGVILDSAILDSATLESSDFSHAHARDVKLRGTQAHGAKFTSTDFARSDLSRSDFSNTMLDSANLEGCNLRHCDLSRANLRYAFMRGVRLDSAILDSADLTGVRGLRGGTLETALSYEGAVLDSSLVRELRLSRSNRPGP